MRWVRGVVGGPPTRLPACPGAGGLQGGHHVQEVFYAAAGQPGQAPEVDAAELAGRVGEVEAQVAGAQMVRGGQAPDERLGMLAGA